MRQVLESHLLPRAPPPEWKGQAQRETSVRNDRDVQRKAATGAAVESEWHSKVQAPLGDRERHRSCRMSNSWAPALAHSPRCSYLLLGLHSLPPAGDREVGVGPPSSPTWAGPFKLPHPAASLLIFLQLAPVPGEGGRGGQWKRSSPSQHSPVTQSLLIPPHQHLNHLKAPNPMGDP